jgi:hypothetical protein
MLGVFRKDWETGTHSMQCLFWHFILTYLCLYICICRHIVPFSRTFPATTVLRLVMVCQHLGRNNTARSLVVNEHAQTVSLLEVQRWWRRANLVQKKLSTVVICV